MPSACAFSIDARTSAKSESTAAATLGLDREQALAERRQGPGAFAVGPFGSDIADQQGKGSGGQRGEDLLVERGQVKQRAQREEKGRSAGGTRQDRVADLLGRACFHRFVRLARRHARLQGELKKES